MSVESEKKLLKKICSDSKDWTGILPLEDGILKSDEQLDTIAKTLELLDSSFQKSMDVGELTANIEDVEPIFQILNCYEEFMRISITETIRNISSTELTEEQEEELFESITMINSGDEGKSDFVMSFNDKVIDFTKLCTTGVIDPKKYGKMIDEEKGIMEISGQKIELSKIKDEDFDNQFLKMLKKETKDKSNQIDKNKSKTINR